MKMKSGFVWIIALGAIFLMGIPVAYFLSIPEEKLEVFQPAYINPKLVDKSLQGKEQQHRIQKFELTTQDGATITNRDFEGKIYVADFFFTTCQGICPKMTSQMSRLYELYEDDPAIQLLSHSVTPEIDSVAVLAEYAGRYDAKTPKWHFVTGSKKHIYELARKSYFAATTEGDGGPSDFIHTENFVLVDKERRIRGFYDGTSKTDVDRLIKEIEILKKEYGQG